MRRRLGRLPVPTPAILAAVLVITVFLHDGVSPYGAARSVLIAIVAGALIWLLGWAVLRSPDRSALVGSLVVLALWNPGQVREFLIAAGALAIVPFVVERFTARRLPWRLLAAGSGVFALALLISPVAGWVSWGGPRLLAADLRQGGGLDRLAAASAPSADQAQGPELPDIYLILLDEHARQDALQRDFGLDDSAFLDSLRSKGFDVASGSHSNYDSTGYTLASLFQMQYLDALPEIAAAQGRGETLDAVLRDLTNDNPVFALLRARGYTVVTTAPWYEHVVIRRSDVLVDSGQLNEFEESLLMSTEVGNIVDTLFPSWLGDQFRGSVRTSLSAAASIAATPSAAPRFVLVHVPAPHEPYVLGADGSPVPLRLAELFGPYSGPVAAAAPRRQRYAGEVTYVDGQAIQAVDAIVGAGSRPAVVIVFGDHGSRLPVTDDPTVGSEARVSNLFAALTPGHPDLFGDRPTLVNLFPTLLDAYLGTELPTLPDRSYDFYPDQVEVPLPGSP